VVEGREQKVLHSPFLLLAMEQIKAFIFFVRFSCVNKERWDYPFIELSGGDKVNIFYV